MCTHMVQEWAQGYHGTERSKKRANWCIEEDRGGILLGTHGQDGVQEKNATTQIGPKRQEKHRKHHSKKYALADECITKFGKAKEPQ